jgi:hypothetical protein
MNLSGEVISVAIGTTVKNQAGNPYDAWQLIFKGPDGKVSDITKHMNSLKFNKALQTSLEELKPGDTFTAVLEKKGAFNEVTKIVKGELSMPATAAPSTGKVTGSNYETPVEREWNRVRIIRQSSINYAIQFWSNSKGKAFSIDDVFEVADMIEAKINRKDGE